MPSCKQNFEQFINFHELAKFVKEETTLTTDPVFSPSALN